MHSIFEYKLLISCNFHDKPCPPRTRSKKKKKRGQNRNIRRVKKGGAVMWLRYSKPSIPKNVLEAFLSKEGKRSPLEVVVEFRGKIRGGTTKRRQNPWACFDHFLRVKLHERPQTISLPRGALDYFNREITQSRRVRSGREWKRKKKRDRGDGEGRDAA